MLRWFPLFCVIAWFCGASSSSIWVKCLLVSTFLGRGGCFGGKWLQRDWGIVWIGLFWGWGRKRLFQIFAFFLIPGGKGVNTRNRRQLLLNSLSKLALSNNTSVFLQSFPFKTATSFQESWDQQTFHPNAATWSLTKSCNYTKLRKPSQHLDKQMTCNGVDLSLHWIEHSCNNYLMSTKSNATIHNPKAYNCRIVCSQTRESTTHVVILQNWKQKEYFLYCLKSNRWNHFLWTSFLKLNARVSQ